jgi:peroxiredoxin
MQRRLALGLACLGFVSHVAACAPSSVEPSTPDQATVQPPLTELVLRDLDGKPHRVSALLEGAPLSVVVFFSATCPCVSAHDERLSELSRQLNAPDVAWFMVASETDTSLAQLQHEQQKRDYPFPLLLDENGALARTLDVRYASQAFILRSDASVVYAGSIDSDRRFLHEDAQPYLQRALLAAIEGRPVPPGEKAAYGCALQLQR